MTRQLQGPHHLLGEGGPLLASLDAAAPGEVDCHNGGHLEPDGLRGGGDLHESSLHQHGDAKHQARQQPLQWWVTRQGDKEGCNTDPASRTVVGPAGFGEYVTELQVTAAMTVAIASVEADLRMPEVCAAIRPPTYCGVEFHTNGVMIACGMLVPL